MTADGYWFGEVDAGSSIDWPEDAEQLSQGLSGVVFDGDAVRFAGPGLGIFGNLEAAFCLDFVALSGAKSPAGALPTALRINTDRFVERARLLFVDDRHPLTVVAIVEFGEEGLPLSL